MAEREHDWIDIDGVRLAVAALATDGTPIAPDRLREIGRPVLVFLHEGLGCIALWRGFPAALCAALDLPGLLYDRQGFGLSDGLVLDRRIGYLEHEAHTVLPELLRRLDIGPHVAIGHSDGASIALLHGAGRVGARPDPNLRAIVSMAAHVFVEPVTVAGILDAKRAFETTDLPTRLARYHGDKTARTFANWAELWVTDEFRAWSMTDRLADIRVPVLALQGAEDEYGTPRQVEAICAGTGGPSVPVILPACAHIPHLQQPDRVRELIRAFVARVLETG